MSADRDELVRLLEFHPNSPDIHERLLAVEGDNSVDLARDLDLLEGVWDLRWSSSKQPWLKQAPWLENLQVLAPSIGRGCNLLRLSGPFGSVGGICVQADLQPVSDQRVDVHFRRGGWVGPRLFGSSRLEWTRAVKQRFPAWLDITVLDERLRICRGNAGTIFALLRRDDLHIDEFFQSQ